VFNPIITTFALSNIEKKSRVTTSIKNTYSHVYLY